MVGADAVLDAGPALLGLALDGPGRGYRAANRIDHRAVRLAVVIQDMVQSQVAGVMFTANPVTGRRHEAVIDASPGLGESVVSGAVNPDHFVVDTATGRITERRLGDKRTFIRSLPGGGRACPDRHGRRLSHRRPDPGAGRAGRQGRGALRVAAGHRVGDRCRRHPLAHPGAPDHHPLPDSRPTADGLRVYFCFSLAQGLYRPLTPMGLSAFRVVSSSAAELFGAPVADRLAGARQFNEAGRIFIDLTGVVRSRMGRATVPRIFDVMEARSAKVLRGLFDDPGERDPALPLARAAPDRAGPVPLPDPAARPPRPARPRGAHRRTAQIGADLRARLALPAGATARAAARSRRAGARHRDRPPAADRHDGAVPGFLMLALRLDCSATARGPARCRACCAACRTT